MNDFTPGMLMRIFVDERDRHGAQPLYTAVVEMLRKGGVAGATVFRGVEGYGSHNEVHVARIFSWTPNLPIVIEAIDSEQRLRELLPEVRALVREGLITLEAASYLHLPVPSALQ